MWIGVLADSGGDLHPNVERVFDEMQLDWIIHCGGIGAPEILDRLSQYAPVTGVIGEMDDDTLYPFERRLMREIGGFSFYIAHEVGTPARPSDEIADVIDDLSPKVMLFGRSDEAFNSTVNDRLWFCPGRSARKGSDAPSVGLIEVDGQAIRGEIINLDQS